MAVSLSDNDEMCVFTYLRMNPELLHVDNWRKFMGFMKKMKEWKDVHQCWEQVDQILSILCTLQSQCMRASGCVWSEKCLPPGTVH
ncbi:beta-amylase [Artemisia annua]|uniref:Beta-amylase n=1 Tax=Artemisia annua TaxID=35608 RepID=A0A2U1KM36_ARTAN|nr:beta-amylase [Artemisia annua]